MIRLPALDWEAFSFGDTWRRGCPIPDSSPSSPAPRTDQQVSQGYGIAEKAPSSLWSMTEKMLREDLAVCTVTHEAAAEDAPAPRLWLLTRQHLFTHSQGRFVAQRGDVCETCPTRCVHLPCLAYNWKGQVHANVPRGRGRKLDGWSTHHSAPIRRAGRLSEVYASSLPVRRARISR